MFCLKFWWAKDFISSRKYYSGHALSEFIWPILVQDEKSRWNSKTFWCHVQIWCISRQLHIRWFDKSSILMKEKLLNLNKFFLQRSPVPALVRINICLSQSLVRLPNYYLGCFSEAGEFMNKFHRRNDYLGSSGFEGRFKKFCPGLHDIWFMNAALSFNEQWKYMLFT